MLIYDIMARNFPELMKDMNHCIDEALLIMRDKLKQINI